MHSIFQLDKIIICLCEQRVFCRFLSAKKSYAGILQRSSSVMILQRNPQSLEDCHIEIDYVHGISFIDFKRTHKRKICAITMSSFPPIYKFTISIFEIGIWDTFWKSNSGTSAVETQTRFCANPSSGYKIERDLAGYRVNPARKSTKTAAAAAVSGLYSKNTVENFTFALPYMQGR